MAFVTGAGGFIGGHVAAALERSGWRVAALGRKSPPDPWPQGALRREGLADVVEVAGTPEVVVHCAGTGSVRAAEADPEAERLRTVGGLIEVLSFMSELAPGARLILLSSAAVYGEGEAPKDEVTTPLQPISAYGEHKRIAEATALESGLDVAVVRFFSIYGPGLRKQLFWDLCGRLMADPETLCLGGTGEERRDFLYIDDAVDLIGRLIAAGSPPPVVNGGSGRATTVREAAGTLIAALGARAQLSFSGEVRPGDPKVLVADTTRAEALGFGPRTRLDDGLARFAAWARPLLEPAHG